MLASLVMGAGLWLGAMALQGPLHQHLARYAALGALVVGGSVLYFAAGGLIGAFRLSDFRSLRRRG
jgi:putative peptidoglycan lipid II flippase